MEFTAPLVLATGSHVNGSGYACAMEVLSWTMGQQFTDFPNGVDHRLAKLVQHFNDYAGQCYGRTDASVMERLLTPAHALRAFELATLTIGTGGHANVRLSHKGIEGGSDFWAAELWNLIREGNVDVAGDFLESIIREFRDSIGLDVITIPSAESIDSAINRISQKAAVQ